MPDGWARLASHEGGTVVALAMARAADGKDALFAATAVGLFTSEDGGRHWAATSATPLPLIAAVAPSARFATESAMYAGTQTGFYRSVDGGRTWRQALSGGHVLAVSTALDAQGREHIFVGTEQDGILRSEDGGRTWVGANPGLLDLTVLALAFSPDFARDGTGFAATTSALYRTRNGGKAWREVALPLDEEAVQCVTLSPTFASDHRIFAGTEGAGLWRSDDGGTTWKVVAALPAGAIGAIAFSQQTARRVAVATNAGVALSDDGGDTWRLTGQSLPPVLTLAFVDHGADETLVAGLYRGGTARLSVDRRDADWSIANTGLTATFLTGLVASPQFARDRALLAFGPESGVRVSRDGGTIWDEAAPSPDNASARALAVAPQGTGISLFAATDAGIIRSRNGGISWDMPPAKTQAPMATVATGTSAHGAPLLLAATDDGSILASDDDGDHWHARTTPFAGDAVVALTAAADGVWYVGALRPGTGDATLWRSADGGETWARWLEAETNGTLPLAAAGSDTVVVGLGARVAQPRPHAWHTRDGARAPLWVDTTLTTDDGTAATITALALSHDFATDGAIYAATSAGIFRSRDRGRSFAPWNDGLPPSPILALATATDAHGTRIFALGVDGTIWQRSGSA